MKKDPKIPKKPEKPQKPDKPKKPDATKKKVSGKKGGKKSLKDWLKAILIALVVILLLKTFAGQSVTVLSSRMEKAIYVGDHIYVNKLALGARLPITLLTVPFTENTLPFSSVRSFVDWITLPCIRIPGYSDVQRNNMIAFNYPFENDVPIDMKTVYVKRCVGLPGDTIRLDNKKLFVNNQEFPVDSEVVQYLYRVVVKKGKNPDKEFWKKYDLSEKEHVANQVYDYNITLKNAALLKKESIITDVRALKQESGKSTKIYFPNSDTFRWNVDYFGDVLIPQKHDTIGLTQTNLPLYKRIIEVYEKNKLETDGKRIFINDVETTKYVIKLNYYFILDDNRDVAKDSRYWGFLPEDHIIGRAAFVWFSFDKNKSGFGKIRWNRIFKGL